MKSEYAQWQDELARERLTITERVAKWFDRPKQDDDAEPDHFVWKDVGELFR